MTEIANGISQNQDTSSSLPVSNSVDVNQEINSIPEERTFRQSDVNDIVKKVKYAAVEDYKRKMSEQPNYAQQKYADNGLQNQPPQAAYNTSPNDESFRKIAADEARKHFESIRQEALSEQDRENAQRTVKNFQNKFYLGKEKYQDFENVVGTIRFERFPNTVELVTNHVENSPDVLYELGKDRTKLAAIEQLASYSREDAVIALNNLSNSIKANQVSSNQRIPNEPLSHTKPSNVGTDNGGFLSVSDYRKKYRV